MAADLHALLAAAEISPPYILVGHSVSGIIARRSTPSVPALVAGMLLMVRREDQEGRFAAVDCRRGSCLPLTLAARRQARILGARRLAAGLGLIRGFDADIARGAPPEYADADRAITLSTRFRRHCRSRELLMMTQMGTSRQGSAPSR